MSTLFVLDTNVLSELMKDRADPSVLTWFGEHQFGFKGTENQFATTSICEAEIYAGIGLCPAGKKRKRLLQLAQVVIQEELCGSVFALESETTQTLAHLFSVRKALGLPLQFADACIAAICIQHKAVLLTRNVNDFAHLGIEVHNPWEKPDK